MSGQKNGQNQKYIRQITYDLFEQRTAIKYGNNIVNTYEYDPKLRRLQNMKTQNSNNIYLNYHYSYVYICNITKLEYKASSSHNKKVGCFYYNYTYDLITLLPNYLGTI